MHQKFHLRERAVGGQTSDWGAWPPGPLLEPPLPGISKDDGQTVLGLRRGPLRMLALLAVYL